MKAYLIERLFPTGWRKSPTLHWRFGDAEAESRLEIRDGARGIRILSVSIDQNAVTQVIPDGVAETVEVL